MGFLSLICFNNVSIIQCNGNIISAQPCIMSNASLVSRVVSGGGYSYRWPDIHYPVRVQRVDP